MASDYPAIPVRVKNEVYVGVSLPCVRVVAGSCCGLFPSVSYQIMLDDEGVTWNLERSYSECAKFYNIIKEKYRSCELGEFPPKKITPFLDSHSISERKAEMEKCLQTVLQIGDIDKNEIVRSFFKFELCNLVKNRDAKMQAHLDRKAVKLEETKNFLEKREDMVHSQEVVVRCKKQALLNEKMELVEKHKKKILEHSVQIEQEKQKFFEFGAKLMGLVESEATIDPEKDHEEQFFGIMKKYVQESQTKEFQNRERFLSQINRNKELYDQLRDVNEKLLEFTTVGESTSAGSTKPDEESNGENNGEMEPKKNKRCLQIPQLAMSKIAPTPVRFPALRHTAHRFSLDGLPHMTQPYRQVSENDGCRTPAPYTARQIHPTPRNFGVSPGALHTQIISPLSRLAPNLDGRAHQPLDLSSPALASDGEGSLANIDVTIRHRGTPPMPSPTDGKTNAHTQTPPMSPSPSLPLNMGENR